jgi:hypothetical protein
MASRASIALAAGLAAMTAGVSFLVFEPLLAVVSCLLGWTMLAIAVIDAEHRRPCRRDASGYRGRPAAAGPVVSSARK